jgi:hypothetical protein
MEIDQGGIAFFQGAAVSSPPFFVFWIGGLESAVP